MLTAVVTTLDRVSRNETRIVGTVMLVVKEEEVEIPLVMCQGWELSHTENSISTILTYFRSDNFARS